MASKDTPIVTKLPSISALPVGVSLQEFEITGVLGEGGFGIVYLARDRHLGREVAIKEYMPASLAARGTDRGVVVRSHSHQQTFEAGLQSFISEARLLAHFKHPALVEIFRFWEQNGTAYMAMPFYRGVTLKQHLKTHGDQIDEPQLRALLLPLLDGLDHLHEAKCYHRDIAPDNILILENGKPILLDFGAARRIVGDVTTGLTVILKPGYAPVEQYADDASVAQGPWTDIYGLAAICYLAITKATPPASVTRLMRDPLAPLVSQSVPGFSKQFLLGVDKGLAVRPENRPQSITEFRRALGLDQPMAPIVEPSSAPNVVTNAAVVSPTAANVPATAKTAIPTSNVTPQSSPAQKTADSLKATSKRETASEPSAFPFLKGTAKTTSARESSDAAQELPSQAAPSAALGSNEANTPKTSIPIEKSKPGIVATSTPLDEDTVLMGSAPKAKESADADSADNARKRGKPWAVYAVVPALLLIGIAVLVSNNKQTADESSSQRAAKETPSSEPVKTAVTPEPPVNASPPAPDPAALAAQEVEKQRIEALAKLDAEKLAADEKAKADEKQKADEKLKAMSGTVALNILPWGEVFINGQSRGVSPPRKRIVLVEGRYNVMVRNGAFEPYVTTLEVRPGEQITLKHEFK